MIETTTSDAVLAQLEALTARLDEQAGQLRTQAAEIAELRAENTRLVTALATPAAAVLPPVPATTSRRGMLRRVLGASAAAALLLVAKEAGTAHADTRTTLVSGGTSTNNYGLASAYGAGVDPNTYLPTDIAAKGHGVIGVDTKYPGTIPYYSGVLGAAGFSGAAGVQGLNTTGPGVYGQSTDTVGVQGVSAKNAGVYGVGPIGVFALGSGTAAVYGTSNTSYGAWGNSGASSGLIGTSASYIGVEAVSTGHWGLRAKSPTYAGVFEGNVFVTGQVIALGGVVGASAQAAGASGARTVAEDVGEATLVNGKATVALDKAFAEEAKGWKYHVFVTPHDASARPLAVVARRGDAFDVQELAGTGGAARPGGSTFSYRVIARRTAPAGTGAAPLAPPDLTTVKPTPKPPEPPRAPEPSGASDERRRP